MFDVFENRLTIKGILEAQTGLRIGTGRSPEPVGTDLPVLRDAVGHPYIPGSTFKGVVRSTAEQLIRSVISGTQGACYPTGEEAEQCISRSQMADWRAVREKEENANVDMLSLVEDKACLVCLTFGSPWLASHVQFRDLAVQPEQWFGQFQVRDGVGIDRDTGAVGEGLLYDYETVPAGTQFHCTIILENCQLWQRGLVWLALLPFIRGEAMLGGFRSRGLGWVKLLEPELRLIEAKGDVTALIDGLLSDGTLVDEATRLEWIAALKTQLRASASKTGVKTMLQPEETKENSDA